MGGVKQGQAEPGWLALLSNEEISRRSRYAGGKSVYYYESMTSTLNVNFLLTDYIDKNRRLG